MKTYQNLFSEINRLTLEIKNFYPELYIFLDEFPDTLPVEKHPRIDEKVLQQYLESLQQLIFNRKKFNTSSSEN